MPNVCHALLRWWHLGEEMQCVVKKVKQGALTASLKQEIILVGNVDLAGDTIVGETNASCVLKTGFQEEVYPNVAIAVDYHQHRIGNSDASTNVFVAKTITSINSGNALNVLLENNHHIKMKKISRLAYHAILIHSAHNVACCVKNVCMGQFKTGISEVVPSVLRGHSQTLTHFSHQVHVVFLD